MKTPSIVYRVNAYSFIVLFPKFRETCPKPHLCSVSMRRHVTQTIIQVIPATTAGETTLQMNLERELGHPNIPKPVSKDWKLICPTNDCMLKCTVSTWWTHACIFNALSAKSTVKPLVPKAKTKIHSLPFPPSHKLHHCGKNKTRYWGKSTVPEKLLK